jgi:hypothetical protein
MGPSTKPSTTGGRGQPARRITWPIAPKPMRVIQSPSWLEVIQAPMKANTMMPGTSRWPRTKVMRAICRLHSIRIAAPTTLAIAIVHIIEKVTGSFVVSMSGPGRRPWITKAPSRIDIDGEPGIPNATVGRRSPAFTELFAASGAITPRMSPLPNCDLSFADCTACP